MREPATFHDLKGASVFITGGGSGIGAALTAGFRRQGAKVAFAQRPGARGFCDGKERATGQRPLVIPCDITDTAALRATADQAAAAQGPVTVLVSNAANDQRHATPTTDEALRDGSKAINLRAGFFAAQAVIPGMRAAGGGPTFNLASISYRMGKAGDPAHVTTNSGINGRTRALAREFGPDRIRLNALAPGWVLTEKPKDLRVTPGGPAAHLARSCLADRLAPEDIVGGVSFLAPGGSRMMTGPALMIDGGVVVTG